MKISRKKYNDMINQANMRGYDYGSMTRSYLPNNSYMDQYDSGFSNRMRYPDDIIDTTDEEYDYYDDSVRHDNGIPALSDNPALPKGTQGDYLQRKNAESYKNNEDFQRQDRKINDINSAIAYLLRENNRLKSQYMALAQAYDWQREYSFRIENDMMSQRMDIDCLQEKYDKQKNKIQTMEGILYSISRFCGVIKHGTSLKEMQNQWERSLRKRKKK